MARNPLVKTYRVLGFTLGQWTAIKNAVTIYLVAHEDEEQIPDATLRALDPALANQRVWNQISVELGL